MNKTSMAQADWQILNSDYSRSPVDKTAAGRYKAVQRGSIRLVCDLYRTEPEQERFVADGLRVKLPGQKK